MSVVVWITEGTWPACVDATLTRAGAGEEIVQLYVYDDTLAETAHGAFAGLLGRGHPERDPGHHIEQLSESAGRDLLDSTARQLGRPARTLLTHGEAGEGFMEAGRPGGQHLQGFVDVPPGSGLGYPESGPELRERLILAQMDKGEQRLLEATELTPAGVAGPAVLVQQPGNMLNQLVRDVEHGSIRNHQGPFGRRCAEWNHTPTTRGPVWSPHQLTSPFHPPAQDERGSVTHTRRVINNRVPTFTGEGPRTRALILRHLCGEFFNLALGVAHLRK
ncbi:hypothetical protein QFZ22_000833 [Streptomyces canus]|uniref:Uncharacterized protein n=1 Tax=Streptomyces canus TaxID=58343 RepID=A0AAW8F5S1_9ACTN|nr:hypothetical protein [Streptomyces canus]